MAFWRAAARSNDSGRPRAFAAAGAAAIRTAEGTFALAFPAPTLLFMFAKEF
jgi:hypothetical protein